VDFFTQIKTVTSQWKDSDLQGVAMGFLLHNRVLDHQFQQSQWPSQKELQAYKQPYFVEH